MQAALYNGRGEAGVPATPGGQDLSADLQALADSGDHRPSAQGNLAAGHSPAWHGAGAGAADEGATAQNNAAALSGIKTQEFAGSGHNQLVFDDSDEQLRVQLASSQHASQLNLCHLIHQADNHRGSLRGVGFELRTDAWGAVRAAQGLLLSSYGQAQAAGPAGDNAPGLALGKQLATLTATFSDAAKTHQTTALAAHIGSTQTNQATISPDQAPAQAMLTSLKGMVANASLSDAQADASSRQTGTAEDKLPHSADPLIAISAKAGLALVAGQDLQVAAAETITIAAGQHLEQAVGGASRVHSGQSIGLLAGAIAAGEQAAGKGATLIAGRGDIQVQAQAGALQVAAQKDLSVQSQSAHIDWAAAKKITLATAGGASIVIEGGNITVSCPGKLGVWAGKKSFAGGSSVSYALPAFEPVSMELLHSLRFAPVGADEMAADLGWVGKPFRINDSSGQVLASGSVGPDGRVPRVEAKGVDILTLTVGSDEVHVMEVSLEAEPEDDEATSIEQTDDPYSNKLSTHDDDSEDFLDPAILAKIMGEQGAADA